MPRHGRIERNIGGFFHLLLIFLIIASGMCAAKPAADGQYLVYVGTYTDHGSKGIYAYRFNSKAGKLSPIGLVAETENPTFLALDPDQRFLYAANEIPTYNGQPTGSVSAFSIDSGTGKLSRVNQVSARSPGPAYITLDRTGKYVLIANYPLGSVTVFPIIENGSLGDPSSFVQHKGSSVNANRQTGPHAHAIELSPDNRFALVADLGIDQLLAYPFDQSTGALGQPRITKIDPGSGPRHIRFSSNGKFVYLINEMFSNITVFSYDEASGDLSKLQIISTLPKDFTGKSTAAEIQIHPTGKFLYASNRGDDSIAVFAINASQGTLTTIEIVSTQGKTPRNFAVDPTGSWLIAANQDSGNITVFRIDQKTGRLKATAETVQLASPVCITFDDVTTALDRK